MTRRNFLSLFPLSGIGLPRLKCLFWHFGLPLGLGLIFSYPSDAQVANYGRSPNLTVLTTPAQASASYSLTTNNGFNCPTPSFSVGAFGGGGNDRSNDFTTNYSSDSSINNYGIAVGLSVPLGGDLSRYCKDYGKSLVEKTRIEMEALRRNEQITLLRQCHWLVENKIDIYQEIFKSGAFSAFKDCTVYNFEPLQGGANKPTTKLSKDPPLSEIKPIPSSNLIIQQQK